MGMPLVEIALVLQQQVVVVSPRAHFDGVANLIERELVHFMCVQSIDVLTCDEVVELHLAGGHGQHAEPTPNDLHLNGRYKLCSP